jgi:hypothetical protein
MPLLMANLMDKRSQLQNSLIPAGESREFIRSYMHSLLAEKLLQKGFPIPTSLSVSRLRTKKKKVAQCLYFAANITLLLNQRPLLVFAPSAKSSLGVILA